MVKPKAWQYKVDDPVMSDLTILMSLEDLINNAMGPAEKNIVNYKLIQAVLHILARQLRILETKVELRISDGHTPKEKKKKSSSSGSPSSGSSPKRDMKDIKEEKGGKSKKPKDKADKSASKEKEKAERAEMKDKERAEKAAIKGKDKEEKVALKEKEKAEKYEAKEEERIKKMSPKQRDKYLKEKEKEHEKLEKMTPEEKNKYLESKAKKLEEMSPEEREQKALEYLTAQETRELNKMSPKERDQFLKEKEKEFKKLDKMSPQERQQYFKEKESEEPEKVTSKQRETFIKAKENEILEKMTPKEKAQYLKEKEKESKELEKMSPKEKEKYFEEKEKELKALEKMSPNEIEKYFKEKEKESKMLEKMSPEEKQKYFIDKEKETKTLEKMSPQEKEKYLEEKEADEVVKISPKQREKHHKEKEEELLKKMSPKEKEHSFKEKQKKEHDTGSGTSIAISEVERENEKVLIVKKGPSVRSTTGARGGSIEVVTQSQFELLKAAVERLKEVAGPLPMPALPDNKQLRSDLAKGTASLTDTMQAMQVSARVQAAEQGITRMAGLLTQLAASGALPAEIAAQIEDVKSEMEAITVLAQEKSSVDPSRPLHVGTGYRKSVAIDPMSTKPSRTEGTMGGAGGRPSSAVSGRASIGAQSRTSRTSSVAVPNTAITRNEMDDAIQTLKDDLMKSMHMMTNRATTSADAANGTAKAVSDKMDFALRLNARIAELYSLTADYAEQLSGFDAGVTTQMQSFQEQMVHMRLDLKAGLAQLETANNNAETAAVMELNERYEGLVLELDGTITAHQHLTSFQKQLGDELRSLLEAVETLREQKADRDEVFDGLRDKADNSKLAGLLTEQEFVQARDELEMRLHLCYQKFQRQEAVWMQAVKDLDEIVESKAHMMQVLAIKEDTQDALRAIQEEMKILAVQLGEPTVAVLTRVISRDGHCASCLEPGLIGPTEQTFGIPRPLPVLRPATEPEPCLQPQKKLFVAGDGDGEGVKTHTCKRWVGGSHTRVTSAVTRGAAPPPPRAAPLRHYTDYGEDGKLYRLAEELQPCEECNVEVTEEIKSGEKPRNYGTVDAPICICWPPLPIP